MRLATGSAVLGLFLLITLALRTVTPPLSAHPQVGGGELLWKMMDADPEEVWEGTITWHEVGSRSFDRDDSNSRKIDTEHLLHTVNSTVEVRICGPLASMHLSGISKNRSDERSYRKHRRNPVARCWDDDPEQRQEGRFDDFLDEETLSRPFYDAVPALPPSEKRKYGDAPAGRFMLQPIPPDQYMIHLTAQVYTELNGSTLSSRSLACPDSSGNPVSESHTRNYRTVPFNREPQAKSGEDGRGGTTETIETHPTLYPMVLMERGGFTKEGFASQTTLVNEDAERPGDWSRTLQVSWDFKPRESPCRDAYDLLYQDLAWAEAYADASLAENSRNLGEFKKQVGQQAYQNYGSWLPPDMMGASVAMSVDPATCGLHGFEDAEERVNRQCLPKVIYEAVLAHELQHVRQCQSDQAAFGNTADFHSFARYEVEAHLVGINHLKNYVENHCQESGNLYNMSDVNARIARLEAWLGH